MERNKFQLRLSRTLWFMPERHPDTILMITTENGFPRNILLIIIAMQHSAAALEIRNKKTW